MTIKDLQAFLHLAQSLHFNKTAQVIHMSPSTLSRTIQRMESELGETFFERDNRQVRLTQAGRRLVEFAESVELQWQLLKNDLQSGAQDISGEISIYCTVTAAHLYLPELLASFRKRHPKVEINLETGDVAHAYKKISERQADFAFAVREPDMAAKFSFQHLHDIPFKLIAPREKTNFDQYLQTGKIDWQQLPFVLPESGPAAQRVNQWLKSMNIKPKIYAQVSGHEAIVSMTALGCGVSAVPLPVLENSPVKHKIRTISSELMPEPFDLGIICLRKRLESRIVGAFWNILKQPSTIDG